MRKVTHFEFNLALKSIVRSGALVLFLLNLGNYSTFGAAGSAVINSTWNNSATWSYSGSHRLPTCGDTLTIPASKTVTVNSQHDYTGCGSPIIIYVYGTFQFNNGNKIDLPCGSVVFIMAGGTVKKSTPGGGSSTLISICGTVEWKAADGTLNGVDTLGSPTTLPIKLLSFDAVKNDQAVKLNWTTSSEINNSFFTIEKSINGHDFHTIGIVKGAGNSTFNIDYSFSDNEPINGISYYRLTQTDYDGKSETFDPIAFNYKKANENDLNVIVLKNPFTDVIKIGIEAEGKGNYTLNLYDSEGAIIFNESVYSDNENVFSKTGLESLKPGLYFLQVKSESHTSEMIRILKME